MRERKRERERDRERERGIERERDRDRERERGTKKEGGGECAYNEFTYMKMDILRIDQPKQNIKLKT